MGMVTEEGGLPALQRRVPALHAPVVANALVVLSGMSQQVRVRWGACGMGKCELVSGRQSGTSQPCSAGSNQA